MEQMKEFDKRLQEADSYQFLMCRVLKIIFTILGGALMLFPAAAEDMDMTLALFWTFYALGWAVRCHMTSYLYVKQNGKTVPVYGILKQTPVKREIYIKARRKRLFAYLGKMGLAALVLQLIGTAAACGFQLRPLLLGAGYVAVLFAVLLLLELFDISWSAK